MKQRMKASVLAILGAAMVIQLPAVASDAVSVVQRIDYYVVRGLTEEAIAGSLRRAPPRKLGSFQGQTRFDFYWDYDLKPISSREGMAICEVRNAGVDIEIVIILPRHPTIATAPATLQATWQDFTAALESHELNHAKDAARFGGKIPDALNGMIGPCATLDEMADTKGMEYLNLAARAADDYDAETNHGETEGTFFPGL